MICNMYLNKIKTTSACTAALPDSFGKVIRRPVNAQEVLSLNKTTHAVHEKMIFLFSYLPET